MTPIGAGPLGYPDWQKVSNWDGPPLWTPTVQVTTGQLSSPVLPASRYGYLGGTIRTDTAPVNVFLQWFEDQAQTLLVAERSFLVIQRANVAAQLRIPHLGPWLRVTLVPETEATKWTPHVRLISTNRVSPFEFIPNGSFLISEALNFGGASEGSFFPNSYFAGPMQVLLESTINATVSARVELGVVNGEYGTTDIFTITSAGTFAQRMCAPIGHWRMRVTTTGATFVSLRATVYDTGSS